MDWLQAKDMILIGIGSGVMFYASQLTKSIQELNINVAVIIEKLNSHDDRIKKLEGVNHG